MSIMKKFKKLVSDACVYFTAVEFVLLAVASAFSSTDPEAGGGAAMFLSLGSAVLIFAACIMMSALNFIFSLELSSAVKVLLHCIGSLAAYSLIFIVIPGAWRDVGALFVRVVVFAMLYAIIALVVLIVNSVKAKRRSDDSEYESQFGDFFAGRK